MADEITLENGTRLFVSRREEEDGIELTLRAEDGAACVLHWGLSRREGGAWKLPPEGLRPPGSSFIQGALQSRFKPLEGAQSAVLRLQREALRAAGDPSVVSFVLFYPETGRWDNNRGRNYHARLLEGTVTASALASEIIDAETGEHSWSLMHRFNLCHDLLGGTAGGDPAALSLLFVWLRFSAIRQLDWQRRYNTKPRELSHAQDRLTLRLAELCIAHPENRSLIRMLMSTLGRGGEGQRVRDEILNIMHRHHIKEIGGTFLEQWHQKLHNNATPDDILICEAYIRFLQNNGATDAFYGHLEAGGVSGKRLAGFERPITTRPEFIPHLRDALIYDFEEFLKILKAVHSATDLGTAAVSSGYLLDGNASGLLSFILRHKDDRAFSVAELAGGITGVRGALKKIFENEKDRWKVRDAVYLDLALEEFLRTAVERGISRYGGEELFELSGIVLKNLRFSYDGNEFTECYKHWQALREGPHFTEQWSLRAKSVLDRLSRAIQSHADRLYGLLQPEAEVLGEAFGADPWTITLFSEEVIRGMPPFVLSMLLRRLEPALRKSARLGNWQVISPAKTEGKVEVWDSLRALQGRAFEGPTVIVAESVHGDEEPPEGVTAVITPSSVDLVSHVAVRARNARMLFATCHDLNCLNRLKSLKGRVLSLNVTASGDVVFEEAAGEGGAVAPHERFSYERPVRPEFAAYAIASGDFKKGLVGGKSMNLIGLKDALPGWILLPRSQAVPFGVFEEALNSTENSTLAERFRELAGGQDPRGALSEMREIVLSLRPPEGFLGALVGVLGDDLPIGGFEDAWGCIKRIWASKWNERAYFSRRTWGIPDEDVLMAVLIQNVIEAQYAFVIHTVNPITGARDEVYAEVVPGLGETLVGNYPGRAMGFTCPKANPKPVVTAYPSKSDALYGGGLIFRSDSNVEDLPGYSGAGLYDSVMLPPPRKATLDYTAEPLINDAAFRDKLLSGIAQVGVEVERAAGSPQDIEGAYSDGLFYVVQTRPQVGLDV